MIRKPKKHPVYGMNLVGINFRERWNVLQHATKEELETFIENFNHIKLQRAKITQQWWELRESIINESTQNTYLRKLWRKRHSESFQEDVLYRIDRNINRWSVKMGPARGDGIGAAYMFDRYRTQQLRKDDIVMLTKRDEMGNIYFVKANEIDAKYPYTFNRDNAQLGYIVPLET
tara:strand:+ start:428 stop:952 length:525 start_codon:yes stop_codon:yes gene_type:complete